MPANLRDRLLFGLLLATVFLQGLFELRETDLWVHLNLGRLVWNYGAATAAGPMVYAGPPDARLSPPSWLFGAVVYLLWRFAGGAAAVILAKCALVTLAFFVLLRDALRPHGDRLAAVAGLLVTLAASRYRFVERPDVAAMLLLAFEVWALNGWFLERRRVLWWLPLTGLLWANTHASAILVPIVFAVFVAGGAAERMLARLGWRRGDAPSTRQLLEAALAGVVSTAATLINPLGSGIYRAGGDVLAMDWARQNILELQRPVWPFNPWPFVLPLLLLAVFALNVRRLRVVDVALVVPFAYLALSVKRFLVYLAIVAGPVLARNLAAARASWRARGGARREWLEAALAATAVVVLGVGWLVERPRIDEAARHFGLGVDARTVPERALAFLDRAGIEGRIFDSLPFGGYICWRDYPRRTVFIDPRFNLPADLLAGALAAPSRPEVLERLRARFGFETLLLSWPKAFASRPVERVYVNEDLYVRDPGWVLVHFDDVALVYVRPEGPYAELAARLAVRHLRPANFAPIDRFRAWDPEFERAAEAELARAIEDGGSLRARLLRGLLRAEVGRFEEALPDLDAAAAGLISLRAEALDGQVRALAGSGRWGEARAALRELARLRPSGSVHLRLALVEDHAGERAAALEELGRAFESNPDLLSAPRLAARWHEERGETSAAARMRALAEEAGRVDRTGGALRRAGEARAQGLKLRWIQELESALAADPASPALLSELGYALREQGNLPLSYEYQRTALDVDPLSANAWYGLALVQRDAGRRAPAAACFRRFLELEPASPFAPRARQELAELGAGQ